MTIESFKASSCEMSMAVSSYDKQVHNPTIFGACVVKKLKKFEYSYKEPTYLTKKHEATI